MDPNEFRSKRAGRIVTSPEGHAAFVPAPLPLKLRFTGELALALSRADAALGALSGLGAELPCPAALTAPFLRQEALCNSRIEGADVTLTDVLLHEISAAPPGSSVGTADRCSFNPASDMVADACSSGVRSRFLTRNLAVALGSPRRKTLRSVIRSNVARRYSNAADDIRTSSMKPGNP